MAKKEEDYSELINYVNRLSARVSEVEMQSKEVVNSVKQEDSQLSQAVTSIKADIANLKKATETVKVVIEKQKRIIKSFVNDFKGVVKEEQFIHLKEKIDSWEPENFLTRKELKKNL